MKKIVSILTIAVMLVACLGIGAFAADDAVVTIDEVTAKTGDTVTLNVSISEATFRSYGMKLVYADSLELVEIKAGELSKNGFFSAPITSGIIGFIGNEEQTAAGVLVTVTFKVVGGEGKHEVTVEVDGFTKSDNTNLVVSVDAGYIEVAHVHNWVAGEVVAPWCETEGYTIYTCSCGETEKRDTKAALGHDYKLDRLTEEGEWHKCSRCGDEYFVEVEHNPDGGDMIGVVVALMAVAGLGITVLKKKEN